MKLIKIKKLAHRAAALLLFNFLLAGLGGCAVLGKAAEDSVDSVENPRLAGALSRFGAASQRAAQDISPEEEYYLGRAVGALILTRYRLYTAEPALTAYLNRVIGALAVNSPAPDCYNGYHGGVLDTEEITAFSTPAGHILVSRGLLKKCVPSEDALAAVLAHEMAHIQLRHSVHAVEASRRAAAGTSLVEVLAAAAGPAELADMLGATAAEIADSLLNEGYSQEQEFEADRGALFLMASAGYEGAALLDVLAMLRKQVVLLSRTHPAPELRMERAEHELRASGGGAPDTRSYRTGRFAAAGL